VSRRTTPTPGDALANARAYLARNRGQIAAIDGGRLCVYDIGNYRDMLAESVAHVAALIRLLEKRGG
jgi:hypothetical protein